MKTLTYERYLQSFKNAKNECLGKYEKYTKKKIVVSIDEIAQDLIFDTNIYDSISKFYEIMLILLFGNKSISYDNYRQEIYNFDKEHETKTADEITEYIISVLKKYIPC